MMLLYPKDMSSIIADARDYADHSSAYTHDYAGWGDQYKKHERIMWGRIGQGWLRAVCTLNDIPFEDDPSDYTEADTCDLVINSQRVDVKTWKASGVPYQVNAALRQHAVDYYCFLESLTNDIASPRIVPHGFIDFATFWQRSAHVPHGQIIPGTSYTQRYHNGSNILQDTTDIEPIEVRLRKRNQARDTLITIAGQKPIDWGARRRRASEWIRTHKTLDGYPYQREPE